MKDKYSVHFLTTTSTLHIALNGSRHLAIWKYADQGSASAREAWDDISASAFPSRPSLRAEELSKGSPRSACTPSFVAAPIAPLRRFSGCGGASYDERELFLCVLFWGDGVACETGMPAIPWFRRRSSFPKQMYDRLLLYFRLARLTPYFSQYFIRE